MRFDSRFQVWQAACPPKDNSRPVLNMVHVRRVEPFTYRGVTYNAELVAADGYILAVVPAQLWDSEPAGMIRAEVLQAAAKLARKQRDPYADVGLDGTTAKLADGSIMPQGGQDYTFPDYSRIVPDRPYGQELQCQLGFNPELIARLAKALDIRTGMVLSGSDANKPFLLESITDDQLHQPGTRPLAPYAVIMPMTVPDSWKGSTTKKSRVV